MVSGHPCGKEADFEKWDKLIIKQFKIAVDTMTQSWRIEEDACIHFFSDNYKDLELMNINQEIVKQVQIKMLNSEDNQTESKLSTKTDHGNLYKHEVERLQVENNKLQGMLYQEIENSIGLYKKLHESSKFVQTFQ